MKSLKLWLLACSASLVLGCGGVSDDVADDSTDHADATSALVATIIRICQGVES